ncbi:MAG: RIP metalloprotease RseP [Cellvibrio sp.]
MSGFMFTLISFVLAIVVLVTIHELGHFLAARWCGVKVERFSIGFGPVLFRYKGKSDTEFVISGIPLGGYVAMYGGGQEPVPEHMQAVAFKHKSVWQRIAILFAGPLANILLAVVLFSALLLPGTLERKPVVGEIIPGTLAWQAGFEKSQHIISVDGEPTSTWSALNQALIKRLGETGSIHFRLWYPDSDLYYDSKIDIQAWLKDEVIKDPLEALGISLYLPRIPPIVGEIVPSGAADKAGFAVGDTIVKINDESYDSWGDIVEKIRASANQTLQVTLNRAGEPVELRLTPDAITEDGATIGRIGLAPQPFSYPENLLHKTEYSGITALVAGIRKTWETSEYVLLSIKKLILGEISTKNLSGPISIAKVASTSAESGAQTFVGFLALLSVFLAVFNLLPIPTLDGGHLFYYFIEVIRGKPVSESVQQRGNALGFALIICLLCVALFNDITQLG